MSARREPPPDATAAANNEQESKRNGDTPERGVTRGKNRIFGRVIAIC